MTTPGRTRKSIYEMCDKRSVHKSAMKTSEKLKVFNVSVAILSEYQTVALVKVFLYLMLSITCCVGIVLH